MIAVDEFGELIRSFRVCFIDMLDFRVGLFIDDGVEKIDHAETDGSHADDEKDVALRSGRLRERVRKQIEADDAEHDAARKAQQKADEFFRITGEQDAQKPAQPRSAHARNGGDDDHIEEGIHIFSFVRACSS